MNSKFATFIFTLISLTIGYAQKPKNIIFILTDDHRYDYMSFHPNSPDFLNTPAMDRMAKEGAHLKNAFVTTSLCSPSRGSILTGQYAFRHGAVDNSNPMKEGTIFFPESLQKAGYQTSFFGKWHIGHDHDDPKPGFDRWISFQGQGVYYNPELNIDGERKKVNGYITDLLTDYTIEWLEEVKNNDKPFFVYLSHKAVHAEFEPAKRHEGEYKNAHLEIPYSMKNISQNYDGKPEWVKAQRKSWHGVDYMYHHQDDHPNTVESIITRYSESLLAVDESIARVMSFLEDNDLEEETLVIYMGDNGFMLGEHGLIDKRQAYEESMRVPMLAWAPGHIKPGTVVEENVLNIDIGPTFLNLADTKMPSHHKIDGQSFWNLLSGKGDNAWRKDFKYQYYWEDAFPQTPTTFAIRGQRYKYIYYHGIWDKGEFYDLETDPKEMNNLIFVPGYKSKIDSMKNELFHFMEQENAMDVKFKRPASWRADERRLD